MLKINNLTVTVESKVILENFSLEIQDNTKIFLTGANGAGKSTLAQVIIGNPAYSVKSGQILWSKISLQSLTPQERSIMGIFVSFQNPISIPGISVLAFLKEIIIANKVLGDSPSSKQIIQKVQSAMDIIGLEKSFLTRDFNVGFSGGEKKKMELLQLLVLRPKLVILDEIEAGLDKDFMARFIHILKENFVNQNVQMIIITHNSEFIKALELPIISI